MPVLIALTAVIQAFFLYHVLRTGRALSWAFVILGLPVVGCLAYYFAAVFPRSREYAAARMAVRELTRAFNPSTELTRRLVALRMCPSVANKIAAAEEFMRCGVFYEAIGLYRDARSGPHADDPSLLLGLTRAHVNNETFVEAQTALDELKALDARYRPEEARLLYARTLEGLGDAKGALGEYQALQSVYVGLEAKCRYGMLLKQLGHRIQADRVFREMLEHARRFRINLDTERPWIDAARRHLLQTGVSHSA
jgi:hypothetical protein